MIRIFLGNIGSGKTLSAVREMVQGAQGFPIVTNIKITPPMQHIIPLKTEHIIQKLHIKDKKDGTPVYDYKLNEAYLRDLVSTHQAIDITIDEAHQLFNARRSTSKVNIIMGDFMALARRVLGRRDGRTGRLTLITQLPRRLDVITREMATQVRYHRAHWRTRCVRCGVYQWEHSDQPRPLDRCPQCYGRRLQRDGLLIEVWEFASMELCNAFFYNGIKTYYSHYVIHDGVEYFERYNTMQWEDMLSNIYE